MNCKRFQILRFVYVIAIAMSLVFAGACTTESAEDTPLDTFKAYVTAVKKKDTTKMKTLLSSESIKMHEQEAKAQNLTLDDIVKRETLVSDDQKTVEFRNQKIDGDKATLEVKNSFGSWETVPFVREEDEWKIDKKGYADQLMNDIQRSNQEMDDLINQGKQPPSP